MSITPLKEQISIDGNFDSKSFHISESLNGVQFFEVLLQIIGWVYGRSPDYLVILLPEEDGSVQSAAENIFNIFHMNP